MTRYTDFGFEQVSEDDKARRVAAVFDRVAGRYDLMNDLMSFGLHRLWKAFVVTIARVRAGEQVLDIASGTGDLARALARRAGPTGRVCMTDINGAMLAQGRARSHDAGLLLPAAQCDAERLPFPDAAFDCVTVGFGLRNMTRKEIALGEMARVLRPGGRLFVLEFSRVRKALAPLYDQYAFKVLPWLGARVAGDADAYRYLAESIRRHPDAPALAQMMRDSGFAEVEVYRLGGGVVAVHRGLRL